ncbi:MAG TPA: transcriptional regulator [Gammaproteobacteria bacterium]|nr:transcriptional regulator [Gammaproteobacteria bacterium]HQZ87331.1 transcriptional regulator [Gammaproteobacteria bacterium]HRA42622.1 transcriptional regulator [Gammaproteobacteria bacterium]
MSRQLSQIVQHWGYIAPTVSYPKNDNLFDKLVNLQDELLTIVGSDEKHALIGLLDIISHFIEEYELNRCGIEQKQPTGIDALKFLMEAHHLKQSDLPEIGSQGVVSEILNEKRILNVRQIRRLSKRFNVNPSTFIDKE